MSEKCCQEYIKKQKNILRRQVLKKRDNLPLSFRESVAVKVAHYSGMICAKKKEVIAGFLPIGSEIDSRILMSKLVFSGHCLSLPAILLNGERRMVFRSFEEKTVLVKMPFSTQGPSEIADEVNPRIILIPLVVFDESGNRIGYGGGYYDHAIATMQKNGLTPYLIGIAYECQRVSTITVESHDKKMNAILTEDGFQIFS